MSEFPKVITVYKYQFHTCLEALEEARKSYGIPEDVPMTYVGRLDPMAEGQMMILIGDECKNKDAYLDRNKTYQARIILGIGTDTLDAFGVIDREVVSYPEDKVVEIAEGAAEIFKTFIGKHRFPYPKYSTKGMAAEEGENPMRDMEVLKITTASGWFVYGKNLKEQVGLA